MLETVHVITWCHADRSGGGVVAAFNDPARADVLLKVLENQHAGVDYAVEAVPYDSTPAAPTEGPRNG